MENKPHITKKKERIVTELVSLMKEYPVIGIVDMTDLPALQFQRIKSKLRDILDFRMVKKRLIKIALDKSERKDVKKLKDRLEGIPALIFSKEDPFKLAKAIKKETSPAPAKSGQMAPDDIVLPAGPTPFMAGPMIGELGVLGIKTKVESGKINLVEDKVLVKKGDVVEKKIAELLGKLGVEPMQIGLNLLLTYKDGEILEKDILFVDEKLYLETLQQFARESENLAIYIGYVCKDTIEKLLSKAYNEAKAVSGIAKLEEKMEVKEEPKTEEKPVEETKEPEKPKEETPKEEPKTEEKPVKQEETKEEEKVEEPEKKEPVEEKTEIKEELKEEPKTEENVEEKKEAPDGTPKVYEEKEELVPIEQPKEEKLQEEEPKKETVEEEAPEKKGEGVKEEPMEEPKEETKLKDIKEETKIGMKAGKDITKKDIDLAAKQLQNIQDKIIKGGK